MSDNSNSKNPNALPVGARVNNYVIQEMLGDGGFSIVYMATELPGWKRVIIKEYLPAKLARRGEDNKVEAIDEEAKPRFNQGRKLFFQEANALVGLNHPNIVRVTNFFRALDTIYMVMEYEEGQNLQSYIQKYKGNLSEKFLLTIFPPLLEGLKTIHEAGFLHLDIKPGNVHLCLGGKPLLLDFGAVHKLLTSRQYQSGQVVTPGFSPYEQYNKKGYVGPWTDLYSIGATMRSCIEGTSPPAAIDRHVKDEMKSAVEAFGKQYNKKLLSAIDWAMEVDAMLRPQTVDDMLHAINNGRPDIEKNLSKGNNA